MPIEEKGEILRTTIPRSAPNWNSRHVKKGHTGKGRYLISGHKTDSIYRRYNIVDMEVVKTATAKIGEHQREMVKAENNHRTATVDNEIGSDDKGKRIN